MPFLRQASIKTWVPRDIGGDETSGSSTERVNMGFRGKVNDDINFFFGGQLIDEVTVTDIAFDKLKVPAYP